MQKRTEKHVVCADLKLCLQHAQAYEEILEKNGIEFKINHYFFSKEELKGVMRGYKIITFNCSEEFPVKVFKTNKPTVEKSTVGNNLK